MHHYFEAITNTSGDSLVGYFARVIDPATQNTVTLAADDNGTPIVTVSGIENMASTDAYGNLDFYVVPGTYHLDIYAPNGTSFIMRIANVAMNSTKGDPGPTGVQGDSGPANSTYATQDAVATQALVTNKSAIIADPSSGGTFAYVAGNFTTQIATDTLRGVYVPAVGDPAGANGAWVRMDTAPVNPRWFGAKGDGVTDDTGKLSIARAVANLTKRTVYLPSGNYAISDEWGAIKYGLIGENQSSTAITVIASSKSSWATGGSTATGRKAAVIIDASDAQLPTPNRGYRMIGAATRNATRSGDASTIGFYGTGILYINNAFAIHSSEIKIDFFYKGIEHSTNNGHFGGTSLSISNCWYNLYFEKNTGDYRYIDCVFTGALFAAYGFRGSTNGGVDVGGVDGFTGIGCHAGFAPYVWYQEDGNGTVGMLRVTMIDSSAEQVGNAYARLGGRTSGQRRVSKSWVFINSAHIWTSSSDTGNYNAYTITNDATNHPIQTYAVADIDILQGGGIETIGEGLSPGTSGYVYKITSCLDIVKDPRGAWVVSGAGAYNAGNGMPYFAQAILPQNIAVSGTTVDIVTFALPNAVDGYQMGEVSFSLNTNNATGGAQRLQVHLILNGVEGAGYRFIDVASGLDTTNFRGLVAIPAKDRTNNVFTVGIRLISVPGGITFNAGGLNTDAVLRVFNNAVIS